MFSRSIPALLRRRPPFASFFKAVSAPLGKARQAQRMQTAGVLWRRTAPKFGIRFCAPRVGAALRIYRKEGKAINRQLQMTSKPALRSRGARPRSTPTRTPASKRRATYAKLSRQSKRKAVTPFAVFRTEVMRRTKLPYTAANRKRVLRLWIMTGQQRSLSAPKRVEMAVRLLKKDRKRVKKLSMKKKIRRPRARRAAATNTKKSASRNRGTAVRSKSLTLAKKPKKALRSRHSRKAVAHRSKKSMRARAPRRVPPKGAVSKGRARKISASRKAGASRRQLRRVRRAASAKSRPQLRVATRRAKAGRRQRNPYIRFYRHMRMTGLIPNQPREVGSHQIKALWMETHSLKGLNRRIARATQLLEERTGSKSMISPPPVSIPPQKHRSPKSLSSIPSRVPAARKGLSTFPLKQSEIKVPSYYNRNPFGATYAALLPMLREIPSSTRMAQVAKAWTRTTVKNDKRSAKARIAAVAEALKK
ncbi:hypothetical protein LSCM1_00615 [Leishmania martiniquensis]|uniref:Mkiaa0324 protein-like protein n=1 Tax=Leishmania martiniquensis TaxID=1580590 RepID=A0A836G1I1_9TRYP|nr:hypothetical protein LSCM1_00615 [Leishmania martiniquensis]